MFWNKYEAKDVFQTNLILYVGNQAVFYSRGLVFYNIWSKLEYFIGRFLPIYRKIFTPAIFIVIIYQTFRCSKVLLAKKFLLF